MLLLTTFCSRAIFAAESSIHVVADKSDRPAAVETAPLPKEELERLSRLDADDVDWTRLLGVYVLDANGKPQSPPLAGHHEIIGNVVRFTPQFSLRPGARYEARFVPPFSKATDSSSPIRLEIKIPLPPPAEPTRVTAIYPTAATLPENHLRFYIHFSSPMTAGEAYSHVKLVRDDGTPVSRAFLEIGEELWDPTGQRLTLLFDPGRVKKGLKPREEFGPVLMAGEAYRLVIDKSWHDAAGQPLAAAVEKRFTATTAVETALDARRWQLSPPKAGSRDALVVRFPRPLDHALLFRMMTVAGPDQQLLAGDIAVSDDERSWQFQPNYPWPKGEGSLVVDTTIEDPSGNNLARPFEVDVFEQVDKTSAPEFIRVPFTIN